MTEAIDGLLPLALGSPREALAKARAVLAEHPGNYAASVAHQAVGIVARDIGDVREGVRELRTALRLARLTGSPQREADVLASLGAALVYAGRTADGLASFDQALHQSSGVLTGQVLYRRAVMLWTLGRHGEALEDLRRAISVLRRAGDDIYTARALTARGLIYTDMGSPGRADADFVTAERLFAETGQDLESIYTVHDRAMSAFAAGDLVTALSCLDEAARRYRLLDAPNASFSIDRCTVLLAAGLADDALAEADAAVTEIEQLRGRSTWKAELLLTAARCALAADQPQAALDWAKAARRLFRLQQRTWWQAHAAGLVAQAKYATGLASARLLRESERAAAELATLGSSEMASMHLLAGRVALKLGRPDDACRHFTQAAQSRHRGPPWSRAAGWLSEALRAELDGDLSRVFSACHRGLGVLDEHRFTLGASELRAQATAHGSELAALAQRYAARAQKPRLLLAWSERWRATALAVPPVRPVDNEELSKSLTAFRAAARRLDEARQSAPTTSVQWEQRRLEREQRQLERAVRACSLRTQNPTHQGPAAVRIPDLLGQLGDTTLVEIVDVDGTLHVLVCGDGKVRRFTAGQTEDADRAAGFICFALRRLARTRPGEKVDSGALAILESAGPKLQERLLGPAARHLGDGPVVIVPPGKLHAIPWALIPELHDRVVSVTPSAGAWLRARATPPPRRHHVTLARGPGLPSNGAEIPSVTGLYDDVTVLADGDATAEKVLYALDGAWLAHVAAHGVFRADSPLFSSLRMEDGPLTAYDFEQLHRAPHRLVLSSCESGALAPAGADELLGLVSSLLPLGTAGIIAAIAPLNDYAVVPVMLDLHRNLRAGQSLAESVHAARRKTTGDPVHTATALSLVAMGAA